MEDFSDPNLRLSSYDFARQMNIQRTMLMRAYLRGVGSAIAAGVRGFARVCVRFAKQAVAWQRLQRDIHALQKLDDRMLADIGVSRDEFEWIVRNGRPVREMPHFAPWPSCDRAKAWSKNGPDQVTQVRMISCGKGFL